MTIWWEMAINNHWFMKEPLNDILLWTLRKGSLFYDRDIKCDLGVN